MKKLRLPANWYRDLWLLLITVGLLLTVQALSDEINEQRAGRKTGTTITCVITSSILQGSHSFIIAASSAPLPGKIEARLVSEGYPSKKARKLAAERSADDYTKRIQDAVVQAVGDKARGLIVGANPKPKHRGPAAGTVNCAQLKTLTKAR